MEKYLIVIEKAAGNFSAYSPDLPGGVATGKTKAAVRKNMRDAIRFHLEAMREDEQRIPAPTTTEEYVVVE